MHSPHLNPPLFYILSASEFQDQKNFQSFLIQTPFSESWCVCFFIQHLLSNIVHHVDRSFSMEILSASLQCASTLEAIPLSNMKWVHHLFFNSLQECFLMELVLTPNCKSLEPDWADLWLLSHTQSFSLSLLVMVLVALIASTSMVFCSSVCCHSWCWPCFFTVFTAWLMTHLSWAWGHHSEHCSWSQHGPLSHMPNTHCQFPPSSGSH